MIPFSYIVEHSIFQIQLSMQHYLIEIILLHKILKFGINILITFFIRQMQKNLLYWYRHLCGNIRIIKKLVKKWNDKVSKSLSVLFLCLEMREKLKQHLFYMWFCCDIFDTVWSNVIELSLCCITLHSYYNISQAFMI